MFDDGKQKDPVLRDFFHIIAFSCCYSCFSTFYLYFCIVFIAKTVIIDI